MIDSQTDKISVIIPVHNGAKWLNRIAKCVLEQSWKNLELIFIENFSTDNSLNILKKIAERDTRVKVLESKLRGTSLARKKGIEYATGKYSVFMDQDDMYNSKHAIERMHQTIVETNSEICQFSFYGKYPFGYQKKFEHTKQRMLLSVEEVRKREVASLVQGSGLLNPNVWSKIFLTDVLKDAVKRIEIPLYFAEDQFLNICALTSQSLKHVCIDNSGYYEWTIGTGFSSSKDSGDALIEDYKKTRPIILDILHSFDCDETVIYRFFLETVNFIAVYLIDKTKCKLTESNCALIKQVNHLDYVMEAKHYFNSIAPKEILYEELIFLSSDYSPEDFCNRYKYRTTKSYKINSLLNKVKKILK